jgi:hypothetical protein
MPLVGSCLCGDVAFEISAPVEPLSHCHCSMCRKSHGAPFASYVGTTKSAFRWLRGKDGLRGYESSPGTFRQFCARCGSVAPTTLEQMDRVFVPAGLLAGEVPIAAMPHFFVGSKAPWYTVPADETQFDEYPPSWADGCPAPRKTEPTPEAVRGGCLCGAVAYETPRPLAGPIVLCHCGRCRRARAAAHNANVFVELERFRWLRGAEKVEQFKVPEAERYTQAFCRDCGSKVPALRMRAVIPAGSFDDDPGVRPGMHIFVDSKAPWFEIHDDLPRYAEYPTRQH